MVRIVNKAPLARKLLIFACVFVVALFSVGGTFLVAGNYLYLRPALMQQTLRFGGSARTLGEYLLLMEAPVETLPGRMADSLTPPKFELEYIFNQQIPLSAELQAHTYEQCIKNDLSYPLILAIMWRESRFQLDAVNINQNGTQDSGVMQINDINKDWLAQELGVEDLMDPRQNITAGTEMLGRFTRKYGEHKALLAYQFGETGMEKRLEKGLESSEQLEILYAKRADFEEILR